MFDRRVVLVRLLVPLLAGCTGDPVKPAPLPSPTVTESSPTVSPTAEATPPEAARQSAVRAWVAAYNQMQADGQTDAFRALGTTCAPCTRVADRVEKIYGDGGYVHTDGWRIGSLRRTREAGAGFVEEMKVDSSPTEYVEAKSGQVKTFPGGVTTYWVTLSKSPEGWLVQDYIEVQAP